MRGNAGANRLARAIQRRIVESLHGPDALELATVQGDLSLLFDRFSTPIPRGDYLVCRSLTLQDPMATTDEAGTETHTHTVPRPAELAPLVAGDRVLVAWVNDGTDPVVLDVVVST